MFCEEIRVPGLPGEENVTDGSVDWYEMDWGKCGQRRFGVRNVEVPGKSLLRFRYLPL